MSKRYIHVGSWNIEHFSKTGGRTENVYALTEHIEMATLDVLAVQEIYVTDIVDGKRVNIQLDQVMDLLMEHTDQSWTYEIFENKRSDDTSQLCGLIWNSSVLTKERSIRLPVEERKDGFWLWDRIPHASRFKYRNKTDFIIIPIHMKSNFGGATKAKKVRQREAQTLIDQMEFVKTELEDLDIIILGDTNCLGRDEKALEIITNNGFEDLNEADAGTFVGGGKPFDRIFLSEDQREFKYSRQYIMVSSNPDEHDRWLSDHFLIKTVIKIRQDDD